MSAPSAGSPNGSPVPGYYPDPSIPGYIRYWNGSSWTPGTSRPAPGPGEPAPAPPAEAGSLPATRNGGDAPTEEQGAEDDDRDEIDLGRAQTQSRTGRESLPELRNRGELDAPAPAPEPAPPRDFPDWDDPRRLHGGAPEPGTAWQAAPRQQYGPTDERQPDVSWSAPGQAPPEAPPVPGAGGHDPRAGWGAPVEEPPAGDQPPPADHTVGIRMPRRTPGASGHGPHGEGTGQPAAPDHTVDIRMPRSEPAHGAPGSPTHHGHVGQGDYGQGDYAGQGDYGRGGHVGQSAVQPERTVGLRRSDVLSQGAPAADGLHGGQQPLPEYQQPPVPHDPYGPQGQGFPPQGPPAAGDRPAWAQQVQHLAQQGATAAPGQAPPGPVPDGPRIPGQPHPGAPDGAGLPGAPGAGPWRPPADNPFAGAAQDVRPAGLGKRLVARLIDALVVTAVAAAVALPFVGKWTAHIQDQIDSANQAGVTRTVWLVDGTTGVYLAVILGAFLLFGLLYEAVPTARWGRTLGKKLLGLQVVDIEQQDAPGFGAALRRWLTYSVLALVAIGVLNVLWCLFDRPWRQCWHDKVARTFVAGR